MALKHVNVVIVGAGAGGGVAAKELAAGGLSVVLLERGKWYSAADCRKDDLRNQRTSALGNNSGPDEDRNPRVVVDLNGQERVVLPSEAATATTRRAWAAEPSRTVRRRGAIRKKTFAWRPLTACRKAAR
jgi:choline dehydrogenase-like flavoprotein